jgi:hypothetical protein
MQQSTNHPTDADIYTAQDISVTKSLVKIGAQTYATANITSVTVATNLPDDGGYIVLLLLGVFAVLGGVSYGQGVLLGRLDSIAMALGLAVVGVFLMALAVRVKRNAKPTYTLVLRTSGGEVRAFTNPDKESVTNLSDGILAAIAAR